MIKIASRDFGAVLLTAASACNSVSMWMLAYLLTTEYGLLEFGNFALCLALATPVFVLLKQDLKSIVSTDIDAEYALSQYLNCRILQSAIGIVVCFVTFYTYDFLFETTINKTYMIAIVLYKFFESVSEIYHGNSIRNRRPTAVAISLFIRFLFMTLYLGCNYWLIELPIHFSLAFATAATLIFHDLKMSDLCEKKSVSNLISIMMLSRFAGYAMFALAIQGNLPRYITDITLGPETLATLAWILYFLIPQNIMMGALSSVLLPRISSVYKKKNYEAAFKLYKSSIRMAVFFAFMSFIMFYVFVRSNLLDIGIDNLSPEFNILVLVLFCTSTMQFSGGIVLAGIRKHKLMLAPIIISAVVLLSFSTVFLNSYELKGILLAMTLSALARNIYIDQVIRKELFRK